MFQYQEPFVLNDDEDDVSSPSKNTENYLWWIPNIVVSQNNLTVPVKNISWLKPTSSQEVEMKQYNFTNNQFVLFNPGSLGRSITVRKRISTIFQSQTVLNKCL